MSGRSKAGLQKRGTAFSSLTTRSRASGPPSGSCAPRSRAARTGKGANESRRRAATGQSASKCSVHARCSLAGSRRPAGTASTSSQKKHAANRRLRRVGSPSPSSPAASWSRKRASGSSAPPCATPRSPLPSRRTSKRSFRDAGRSRTSLVPVIGSRASARRAGCSCMRKRLRPRTVACPSRARARSSRRATPSLTGSAFPVSGRASRAPLRERSAVDGAPQSGHRHCRSSAGCSSACRIVSSIRPPDRPAR